MSEVRSNLNPLAQPFVPHASSSHPSPHCVTYSSISIGHIPLAPPFLPDSGRQTTKTPNQQQLHDAPYHKLTSGFTPLSAHAFPFFPDHAHSINIVTINCRSVTNKLPELYAICHANKPTIICLTETWLSPSLLFSVPGYTCFRKDRSTHKNLRSNLRGYGGVAILIRDGTFPHCTRRHDLDSPQSEALWLELGAPAGLRANPLLICCHYRPPSQSLLDITSFCDILTDTLCSLDLSLFDVFLTGDYNAHNSDWWSGDTTSRAGTELSHVFSSFGLQQLVNFPTRVAPNGRLSCLDLLATNRPLSVRSVDDAAPLAASDHLQVITTLAYNIATANTSYNCSQTPTPPRHAFRKVTPSTWSIINSALFACDWHLLFTSTTVDEAVEKFTTVLDDVLSFYVPQYGARPATPKHGSHHPRQSSRNPKIPWLDKDLQ
eukprot:scpid83118/ scgid4819/ 